MIGSNIARGVVHAFPPYYILPRSHVPVGTEGLARASARCSKEQQQQLHQLVPRGLGYTPQCPAIPALV